MPDSSSESVSKSQVFQCCSSSKTEIMVIHIVPRTSSCACLQPRFIRTSSDSHPQVHSITHGCLVAQQSHAERCRFRGLGGVAGTGDIAYDSWSQLIYSNVCCRSSFFFFFWQSFMVMIITVKLNAGFGVWVIHKCPIAFGFLLKHCRGQGNSVVFDLATRHAFIRKIMGMMEKYIGGLPKGNDAGVLVDLKGKPVAHYYDHKLCSVTSAMMIDNRVYYGSVVYPHIMSLKLDQYPARHEIYESSKEIPWPCCCKIKLQI
ncbi:hypothetical protein V6N13_127839 [Hibiscus sabdariffa]|uniref:Uncharacterized protein n=1 Tax=Hibiscus sabdariffa TaxID=183260 RepID=A0ABR2CDV2_9ROSI